MTPHEQSAQIALYLLLFLAGFVVFQICHRFRCWLLALQNGDPTQPATIEQVTKIVGDQMTYFTKEITSASCEEFVNLRNVLSNLADTNGKILAGINRLVTLEELKRELGVK